MIAAAIAVLVQAAGGVGLSVPPPLPPDDVARSQAEAVVQALNSRLLASSSATATLADWCATHRLAADPRIRAEVDRNVHREPSSEQRARLGVAPDEPVAYRHVRLMCGNRLLSVAENWFVPGRLPSATVDLLARTDTPFGAAIRALAPSRRTISAETLWHPLALGRNSASAHDQAGEKRGGCEAVPVELIRHRALVLDRNGTPLAEVVETYRQGLMAFDVPWARVSAKRCADEEERTIRPRK